jgi:murein DD-endopeptidase MepM/ murein hydrolase activator NlpD
MIRISDKSISPSPLPPSVTPSDPTETQVSLNLPTLTPSPHSEISPTPSPVPATPDFSSVVDPGDTFNAWRPPVYPVPWIPSPHDHFYFANPIAAYDIEPAYTTYSYGDVLFENVVHTGIDIPGDIGTPILAAGDGTVIYANRGVYRGGNEIDDDPYGNAIVIEHSFSYQGQALYTLYAHLDEIQVRKGQRVQAGDQIGLLGNTGKTTGPHLHFEVRLEKNEYFSTRNPDLWISPPQGWGILVGQVLSYEGRLHERQTVYLYRNEDDYRGDELDDYIWIGKSYQNESINPDPYYLENLTISNIPAGSYTLVIPVTEIGYAYETEVEIKPGQVTFVKFNVWKGFNDRQPATPKVAFTPSP